MEEVKKQYMWNDREKRTFAIVLNADNGHVKNTIALHAHPHSVES